MTGDSEESWEPSDEYPSYDYAVDANCKLGKVEIDHYKDRVKEENSSLQANVYYGNEAMPTNRDFGLSLDCHPEPAFNPGGTKRTLQGLHGKQAAHSHTSSSLMPPIIFVIVLDAF